MNKILFIIVVLFNTNDNLFISANSTVKFVLETIVEQLFIHDHETIAVLKSVENKLNDLQFSHSSSCNTDQQCCMKIDNVSKDIENIQSNIIGGVNKITTLTENANSQNALLNKLLTTYESLETLHKQNIPEILKKIKNYIEIISNNVMNLNNKDVISSINKIVTESTKELIKENDIKINELSTQLRRIELNQDVISKQSIEILTNTMATKKLIDNVTIENENNRKKNVDQLMVQINENKNDFKNYLSTQAKKTETLCQQESEKNVILRNIVDEILNKIKTIENSCNENYYEKSKDELYSFESKFNNLEIELQDVKHQNKEILKLLQHFYNNPSYIKYSSGSDSEYRNEYSTPGNDTYEFESETEQ